MAPPDTITVASSAYFGLAKVLAETSKGIGKATLTLASTLDGAGGMAGSDVAGVAWVKDYDSQIRGLLESTSLLGQAFNAVGLRVHQSGVNQEIAEHFVAGKFAPDTPLYPGGDDCLYNDPPSAQGDNGAGLQDIINLLAQISIPVPNADTDKLNLAALALTSFGTSLKNSLAPLILLRNTLTLGAFGAGIAESESIEGQINSLLDDGNSLAADAEQLSKTVSDFSSYTTNLRKDIKNEIIQTIAEGVVVGIFSALLTVPTAGASTGVAAVLYAARVTKAANNIRRLIETARVAAAGIRAKLARVADAAKKLKITKIRDTPVKKFEVDHGKIREYLADDVHRELKWQQYLARGGKLSREKWDQKYDTIHTNRLVGKQWEDHVDEQYGYSNQDGFKPQYKDPETGRIYDFGKDGDYVEAKSGRLDSAQQKFDEQKLVDGDRVTYHLLSKPSNKDLQWLKDMESKYPGKFNYTVENP